MKKVIILLFILLLLTVSGGFLYFNDRLQKVESRISDLTKQSYKTSELLPTTDNVDTQKEGCGDQCKKEIESAVARAVVAITPTAIKTPVTTVSRTTVKGGTTYIPMGTTYESTSTDWYTIDDTATYIDLINDYGKTASVSWEASLKVAHGNGQAYVRLWDDTNKIAVDGSVLTTENNSEYKLVTTGVLPFWKGRNLYKVQIRSLNSFVVSYTGGKIRISY